MFDCLARWWWARRHPHVSYDNRLVRASLPPLAFPEEFARRVAAIQAAAATPTDPPRDAPKEEMP